MSAAREDPALQKSGTIEESPSFNMTQNKPTKGQPSGDEPQALETSKQPVHSRAVSLIVEEKRQNNPSHKVRRGKSRISSGVLPPLNGIENTSHQDLSAIGKIGEIVAGGLDIEKLVKSGMLVGTLLQQVETLRMSASVSKHPSEEAPQYFPDEIQSMSSGAQKEMDDPKFGKESIFSSNLPTYDRFEDQGEEISTQLRRCDN